MYFKSTIKYLPLIFPLAPVSQKLKPSDGKIHLSQEGAVVYQTQPGIQRQGQRFYQSR